MKSFVRTKVINGVEYLYEITPYYDPKTKKTKQKSKYLGKKVGGKPVRVRQKLPKMSYNYGEFVPLLPIIQGLRMEEILGSFLPEKDAKALLALALNRVVRPLAMSHIESWYDGTVLSRMYGELPLSSQSLSNLLHRVGESDLPGEFASQIIRDVGTSATLIYDLTSLSSYSKLIRLLEYGYNRDGLSLPQVNLSVIIDKTLGIPVMYDLYPGSLVDVSTLKNTIKKLKALGVEEFTLVLDRGFFSTPNLEELITNSLFFIIPASLTFRPVKQLLSNIHHDITDPNNLRLYGGEPLFVMPVNLKLGDMMVKGYGYYSPKREHDERELFYRRLHDVAARLKTIKLRRWMDAKEVVTNVVGHLTPYIKWKVVNSGFDVAIRPKAVSQRVNRMGKFIILYRGSFDWEECLSTYREKDVIEKGFDILKNDLELLPVNVQKESTLRGFLFIGFLALMVRMRFMKLMRESGLTEKHTFQGIMLELEKIKKIELSNGETLTTELTKRHKDILEKLNSCA